MILFSHETSYTGQGHEVNPQSSTMAFVDIFPLQHLNQQQSSQYELDHVQIDLPTAFSNGSTASGGTIS